MATQFSTLPLGSSTGGLTYVFDESLGTFRRGSSSFGPLFGERALSAGGTQTKVLLVASHERGRFGYHVNVGYTAAIGGVAGTPSGLASASLPDEINYTGGVEFIASPRLTLVGDVIGRTLRAAGHLELVSKSFEYNASTPGPGCGGFPGRSCRTASFGEFASQPGKPHAAARHRRSQVQSHR